MLCIIDYGVINIGSLKNTLLDINIDFQVKTEPSSLNDFSHAIIPGVGNFKSAHLQLEKWKPHINTFIKQKKYLLGICLGMQLLFNSSEESGNNSINGLGLIEGKVKKIPQKKGYQIPNMGWNNINFKKKHKKLFSEIDKNIDYYFAHSYYCIPTDKKYVFGSVNYCVDIPAIVVKNNIIGFQFHPEKSYSTGKKLLTNFCSL